MNTPKDSTAERTPGSLHPAGSVAWSIEGKHPRLWDGWKPLITLYGHTHDQALKHAKQAMKYYEGVSRMRVGPLNNQAEAPKS